MIVTIFGANGRVGRQVVKLALKQGHSVRAFVHSTNPFLKHPRLQVIKGDIYNAHQVETAIAGSDAVLSTLGSWGTPRKDILAKGMQNIIPAMLAHKVDRLVSLTGHIAKDPTDTLPLIVRISRMIMALFVGKILKDGDRHISDLRGSSLNWTVLRSPVMTEFGNKDYFITDKISLIGSIHRHAVAKSMVDVLKNNSYKQRSLYIQRK